MGRPGGKGEAGDDDCCDEASGERLEDAGDREAPGAPAGERGGDLGGDRGDKYRPGDPHHDRQDVDEGPPGDAVLGEHVADLTGGGDVVRERPADVVPQRPGDAGNEGSEEREGAEAFGEACGTGHVTGLHVRVLAGPWRCRRR